MAIYRKNLPQDFSVGICRRNLPQKFAVAICCENLPWLFAVGFLVFVSKFFFVYVINSCLYGSKPFLYVSKTFSFVRFSLLPMFLFVVAVAVMGNRTTKVRLSHFEKMFQYGNWNSAKFKLDKFLTDIWGRLKGFLTK